jgi:hypothetical protein
MLLETWKDGSEVRSSFSPPLPISPPSYLPSLTGPLTDACEGKTEVGALSYSRVAELEDGHLGACPRRAEPHA